MACGVGREAGLPDPCGVGWARLARPVRSWVGGRLARPVRSWVGGRLARCVWLARRRTTWVWHRGAIGGDAARATGRGRQIAEGHRLLLAGAVCPGVRPCGAQPEGGLPGRVGARWLTVAGASGARGRIGCAERGCANLCIGAGSAPANAAVARPPKPSTATAMAAAALADSTRKARLASGGVSAVGTRHTDPAPEYGQRRGLTCQLIAGRPGLQRSQGLRKRLQLRRRARRRIRPREQRRQGRVTDRGASRRLSHGRFGMSPPGTSRPVTALHPSRPGSGPAAAAPGGRPP